MIDGHGRRSQMEPLHQPGVYQAVGAQQGMKCGGHHHRGQDKGHRGKRPQQLFSPKLIPGKNICPGQGQQERQNCRNHRLPCRKPQCAQVDSAGHQLFKAAKLPGFIRDEADGENFYQRIKIKYRQIRQGQSRQQGIGF